MSDRKWDVVLGALFLCIGMWSPWVPHGFQYIGFVVVGGLIGIGAAWFVRGLIPGHMRGKECVTATGVGIAPGMSRAAPVTWTGTNWPN